MRRLRLTVEPFGLSATRMASCLLALIAVLTPGMIHAQAQGSVASGAVPGATQSGATLHGSVRDSKARPVAGATVYLQGKDGTGTLSAQADAAGSYRFSGLGEGIYMLRVEAAGYSRATFGPCALGPREAKALDLTLEAGAAPEFFDEPQFTVAGVTDGTNLGGHGSNVVVRTKDSLAKDIASLSVAGDKGPSGNALPTARTPDGVDERALWRSGGATSRRNLKPTTAWGNCWSRTEGLRNRLPTWSGLRSSSQATTRTATCWLSLMRMSVNTSAHAPMRERC